MTWTIIGTGIEGEGTGRAFAIDLNVGAGTWRAVGASPRLFFTTLSGTSAFAGLPERGLQLVYRNAAGRTVEAGFLRNLVATTQPGATGTGRSEQGLNFTWKLDSL